MELNKDQQLLADTKDLFSNDAASIHEAYYFRDDAFTVLCLTRDVADKIIKYYPDQHTSISENLSEPKGFWVNVYRYPPLKKPN